MPQKRFRLQNDDVRPNPLEFENNANGNQRRLFAGMNELAGQQDLFPTDGTPQHRRDANALHGYLQHFTGTELYHRHLLGLIYTDGIEYVAEEAGAYWLIDAVASHQPSISTDDSFQLWTLAPGEGRSATLTCRRDTNLPAIVTQEIEFTDFPFDMKDGKLLSFSWYVCDGTMLLKSEY